jgi:hypothetical protein
MATVRRGKSGSGGGAILPVGVWSSDAMLARQERVPPLSPVGRHTPFPVAPTPSRLMSKSGLLTMTHHRVPCRAAGLGLGLGMDSDPASLRPTTRHWLYLVNGASTTMHVWIWQERDFVLGYISRHQTTWIRESTTSAYPKGPCSVVNARWSSHSHKLLAGTFKYLPRSTGFVIVRTQAQ